MTVKKPALVILAAGMGSRYGGLKQLDEVGPGGETILDYSVYDAIQNGFGKVVFVIRKEFEKAFDDIVAARFRPHIDVTLAFQPVNLPDYSVLMRQKPWGTGHAVLVAKELVQAPFAVANADDFYGRDSFKALADFLRLRVAEHRFAMVGFELDKTLSPHGMVSRGICRVDAERMLTEVVERTNIGRDRESIYYQHEAERVQLSPDVPVSMNLWGFHPAFFQTLDHHFHAFVETHKNNLKSEYYIPLVINDLLKKREITVEVLPTSSRWFGVTYLEDKPAVQHQLRELVAGGVYPSPLF